MIVAHEQERTARSGVLSREDVKHRLQAAAGEPLLPLISVAVIGGTARQRSVGTLSSSTVPAMGTIT
jgi:hypothetical protein